MIELIINSKPVNIPSNWNDVTYEHYCMIIKAAEMPFIERVAVYSGIDISVVSKLNMKAILYVGSIVEFMDDTESVTAFSQPYNTDIKVATQPYAKLGMARTLLANTPNRIEAAAEIIKEYTSRDENHPLGAYSGDDIKGQPITKVIGQITFFFSKLESSSNDTSD